MKNKVLVAVAAVLLIGAGSAFAANTITVNGTAALGGTSFGLDISVDPTANNSVYVQSDHPSAETHLLLRWRLGLGAATAPASGGGRNFRFGLVRDETASRNHIIFFAQRQVTTGNWRMAVWSWDVGAAQFMFAGGHFLTQYGNAEDLQEECDWTQASGGANGVLTCTKVGTAQTFTNSALNDQGLVGDTVRMGFLDFDSFNSAGHVYFDEYESYR